MKFKTLEVKNAPFGLTPLKKVQAMLKSGAEATIMLMPYGRIQIYKPLDGWEEIDQKKIKRVIG